MLNLSDVGGEDDLEDILGQDREPFAFLEESARSPGVVAALGFRSRVEICEKPSAASLAPGGAT